MPGRWTDVTHVKRTGRHAPAVGPFHLHGQLEVSYWLAKLTLLRINPQKAILELNLDILYFSSSLCLEQYCE